MQFTDDPNIDSDLYIVQNPNGPGKTVVRRPRPPPTTTALDDDFDAITLEGATTVYGGQGPILEEGPSMRDTDAAGRRETYHADSKEYGGFGWRAGIEGPLSDLNLGIGGVRSPQASSSAARDSQIVTQTRARQSLFLQDDPRRNSKISVVRSNTTGDGKGGRGQGQGGGGSPVKIAPTQERTVGQRPVKTVTTWRDDVAKSGNWNEARVEHEPPRENEVQDDANSVQSQAQTTRGHSHQKSIDGRAEDRSGGDSKLRGKDSRGTRERHPSLGRKRTADQPKSFSNPAQAPRSERMYSAADLDVPPPPSDISPSEFAVVNKTGSSPIKNTKDYPYISAPANRIPPIPSYHTSPGIGNAKVESSPALDAILMSFQPSLIHIAPILSSLGIRDEQHMRAVARLSEETRDREVKEVALRKGVTVVEWAMLLDRIRSL